MVPMPVYDPSNFGPVAGELLAEARVMSLGPGRPNVAVHQKLKVATVETLFDGRAVCDEQMAQAALAGLWLYHDFLNESHTISQSIETPTGSYWHGIMHRREPDYGNAQYWFRRVGEHPVFESLHTEAQKIGAGARWDPFRFVNACERAAAEGGDLEQNCREIQMNEWWALFDYSFRSALAG